MKRTSLVITLATTVLLAGCMAQSVPRLSLNINPSTHEVSLSNPKDTTIANFSATVSNGVTCVHFDQLTTVMNPNVITTTADGQAKMIDAAGNVAVKAFQAAKP